MPHDLDRRLHALYRDTPQAVVLTDIDHLIVDVNPSFERLFGYHRAEVTGKQASMLFADRQEFAAQERTRHRANAPGSEGICYTRMCRKDGAVFPTRMAIINLLAEDGEAMGFATVVHELPELTDSDTPLHDRLEHLSAERVFLRNLYQRTPAMMHSIDDTGHIANVSDSWLDRLGYARDEVVGRRSTEFLDARSQERAKSVLEAFWRDGRCDRIPYTMLTRTGDAVEVELSAILDTSGGTRSTLAILEDVTERNKAMRDLKDRNARLKEFAHVVAHDLQGPLRHAGLFSGELERNISSGYLDLALSNARDIETSVKRLQEMVRGLLDFAVVSDGGMTLEPVSLEAVLDNVRTTLVPQTCQSKVAFHIAPLPTIRADRTLIERVIENVIANSIKYVAPGVDPSISVRAETTDEETMIVIDDNGIGVAPVFRERIFQPLARLHSRDSNYPGTGIGLSLCRKIVEAHGGKIWADTPETEGTRIVIAIPSSVPSPFHQGAAS